MRQQNLDHNRTKRLCDFENSQRFKTNAIRQEIAIQSVNSFIKSCASILTVKVLTLEFILKCDS